MLPEKPAATAAGEVTIRIRCSRAPASDQWGHGWESAEEVIPVPYSEAVQLLAIQDGGFSVAEEPEEVTEPGPEAEHAVREPAPKPSPSRRSGPARK